MKTALEVAGLTDNFILTKHATERIRQRVGLESKEAATAWVREQIAKASRKSKEGGNTHYVSDVIEIVTNGLRVITVKPSEDDRNYLYNLGQSVAKEVSKMLTKKERNLRKAEIVIGEHTLNRLKARNPNTRALIERRLIRAIDDKQRIMDEIYAVKKAAAQYGVSVE